MHSSKRFSIVERLATRLHENRSFYNRPEGQEGLPVVLKSPPPPAPNVVVKSLKTVGNVGVAIARARLDSRLTGQLPAIMTTIRAPRQAMKVLNQVGATEPTSSTGAMEGRRGSLVRRRSSVVDVEALQGAVLAQAKERAWRNSLDNDSDSDSDSESSVSGSSSGSRIDDPTGFMSGGHRGGGGADDVSVLTVDTRPPLVTVNPPRSPRSPRKPSGGKSTAIRGVSRVETTRKREMRKRS